MYARQQCRSLVGLVVLLAALCCTAAKASQQRTAVYVNMGDSWGAGLGTQDFPVHDGLCDRTDTAWPSQLQSLLGQALIAMNFACSGAHLEDIFQDYKGERAQISRLGETQPDIVSLTIGGNDVGFSSALRSCFTGNCLRGQLSLSHLMAESLWRPLSQALVELQETAPNAQIYLVGYQRIFPQKDRPITGCGWLTNGERLELNGLSREVEYQQREAVAVATAYFESIEQVSHLHFLSTLDLFAGHELCSARSWLFALRPTCIADARCGHPLPAGQRAIAYAVSQQVGALLKR